MPYMFRGAVAFNQDLSAWRPCSVVILDSMFCESNGNFITEHLPLLQETWPLSPPECADSRRATPSASEIEECRAGTSSGSSTSGSSGTSVTTSSKSAPTSSSSSTTSSTGSTTSTTLIISESSRTSAAAATLVAVLDYWPF